MGSEEALVFQPQNPWSNMCSLLKDSLGTALLLPLIQTIGDYLHFPVFYLGDTFLTPRSEVTTPGCFEGQVVYQLDPVYKAKRDDLVHIVIDSTLYCVYENQLYAYPVWPRSFTPWRGGLPISDVPTSTTIKTMLLSGRVAEDPLGAAAGNVCSPEHADSEQQQQQRELWLFRTQRHSELPQSSQELARLDAHNKRWSAFTDHVIINSSYPYDVIPIADIQSSGTHFLGIHVAGNLDLYDTLTGTFAFSIKDPDQTARIYSCEEGILSLFVDAEHKFRFNIYTCAGKLLVTSVIFEVKEDGVAPSFSFKDDALLISFGTVIYSVPLSKLVQRSLAEITSKNSFPDDITIYTSGHRLANKIYRWSK